MPSQNEICRGREHIVGTSVVSPRALGPLVLSATPSVLKAKKLRDNEQYPEGCSVFVSSPQGPLQQILGDLM